MTLMMLAGPLTGPWTGAGRGFGLGVVFLLLIGLVFYLFGAWVLAELEDVWRRWRVSRVTGGPWLW